jgi:hypothetical protein
MKAENIPHLLLDRYPPILTAGALAGALEVHLGALNSRLERADHNSAKQLVAWALVTRIAERLQEYPNATIPTLAAAVAYSSPQSLHRFLTSTMHWRSWGYFRASAFRGELSRAAYLEHVLTPEVCAVLAAPYQHRTPRRKALA